MKSFTLVIFSTCIVLIAACSEKESSPVEPSGEENSPLMPLAVGNFWVRSQTLFDADGNETFNDIDSLTITRADTVDGASWFFASNFYYYLGRENGLWWSKTKSRPPAQLYKYPVVTGDRYTLVDEHGKEVHYTVLNEDATVSVPAGTFTSWKFHLECPACNITDTVWIAPGIGEVRLVALLPDGTLHVRELLRYSVK